MATFAIDRTGVLKMNVGLNANGNLATGEQAVVSEKSFSIPGVASECTVAQADTVFDKIIGDIVGGNYDSTTMVQTLTKRYAE